MSHPRAPAPGEGLCRWLSLHLLTRRSCRIYRTLYDEVAAREEMESRQSGKLESNVRYKTKRGGKAQLEVKLVPKKHRWVQPAQPECAASARF